MRSQFFSFASVAFSVFPMFAIAVGCGARDGDPRPVASTEESLTSRQKCVGACNMEYTACISFASDETMCNCYDPYVSCMQRCGAPPSFEQPTCMERDAGPPPPPQECADYVFICACRDGARSCANACPDCRAFCNEAPSDPYIPCQ